MTNSWALKLPIQKAKF